MSASSPAVTRDHRGGAQADDDQTRNEKYYYYSKDGGAFSMRRRRTSSPHVDAYRNRAIRPIRYWLVS